ncbi:hypothetical protein VPH35_139581 [Triticum aestivum]
MLLTQTCTNKSVCFIKKNVFLLFVCIAKRDLSWRASLVRESVMTDDSAPAKRYARHAGTSPFPPAARLVPSSLHPSPPPTGEGKLPLLLPSQSRDWVSDRASAVPFAESQADRRTVRIQGSTDT